MTEIDKAAEARRKAQRNGEEDPVVIAQRFLNIYRQIHIFTPERKASFDKMLLALPADIRGLFGSLPGGALLQDYVDELAEKEGVEKSKAPISSSVDDEEVSKAKILATALAEAQAQASVKMQAPSSYPQTAAPVSAVASKLSLDKDFATTFAATLAEAMQKNNAAQKDDIRNIIQTLGQTQLQIVKVLQSESAQQRQEMQSIYKAISESENKIANATANQQSNMTKTTDTETQNLLKVLVQGQQQLAERLGKIEAETSAPKRQQDAPVSALSDDGLKKLSQAILSSQENFGKTINILSERQKNDTLEIAKLINESQQQMMNFVVQHNTLNQNSGNASANNNANNIQINTSDYSKQLDQIVEKLSNLQINVSLPEKIFAQSASYDKQNRVLTDTPAFGLDEDKIGRMLQDVVVSQSKLYQEMAQSQTKELSTIISQALKESQKISTQSLVDALKANPVIVQAPANIASNSFSAQNNTVLQNHGPVGEPEIEDIIDISEITPPRHVQTQNNLPHLQPAFETLEEDMPRSDYDAVTQEAVSSSHNAPLFELSEEIAETTAPNITQDDVEAEDNSLIEINATEEAPLPKKKKKKKKKSIEDAEIEFNDVLTAETPTLADLAEDIAQETDTAPKVDEILLAEEEVFDNSDITTENFTETDNISSKDILSSMTPSAPPMDDLPSDEELGLENLLEDDEKKDENFGSNWLGNVEEEDPQNGFEEEPIMAETNFSADDWGFGSNDESATSQPLSEPETPVDDTVLSDGEGEEWVWEYVEDDNETPNNNYGNDNLEPILQQSKVCCGDLFYQNPSFEKTTISSSIMPQENVYNLYINDSADNTDDDPYQKVL